MPSANVRAFMLDRFRTLSKKHVIIGVEQDTEAGTRDVKFVNKVTLRMTEDEYQVVQSQIVIVDPPPEEGGE
jgi:hypothetical protein